MEKELLFLNKVDGVEGIPFPSQEQQLVVTEFKYDAKRMGGAPTISCTARHWLCLDYHWHDDVYVEFNHEKYYIKTKPSSSYSNKECLYVHEIDLVSERYVLENVFFYDVVTENYVVDRLVSNNTKFNFFGTIEEFVGRLNSSLKFSRLKYTVVIDRNITTEAKQVSFDKQVFAQALQQIFTVYELPYYFVGKVIHVGYTENAITTVFKYGIKNSLLSIKRQNQNNKIVNKITGVGSADNIPYYYPNEYNSKEKVEENGGVWILPQGNLMPSIYRESNGEDRFYLAKSGEYISPETGDEYIFDNEYVDGKPREEFVDFPDIKPSIVGVTNANGGRIDMFVDFAYDLDDSDEVDENNEYLHPYFYAKLRKTDGEFGFNLFDHAIDEGEMTISMTSGSCGACSFKVMVNENQKNPVQVDNNGNLERDEKGNVKLVGNIQDKQNDTQNNEVWIALKKDTETYRTLLPQANIKPSTNDTFVILHIELPLSYIKAAEKKLEDELIKYMYLNNTSKYTFSVTFSRIYFAENPDVLKLLNENSRLQVEYNKQTYTLDVSSFSYSKTKDALPEITVDLTDSLTISQNALQTAVNEVKKDILSSVGSIDVLGVGLKYFLRKDVPDYAKELIAFLKGIKTYSAVFGENGFAGGLTGYGAAIDAAGNAELHSLFVRTFLETPELRYNRVTVRMGDSITSCSAGIIESVTPISDTTGQFTIKLDGSDVGTLEVGDIVMQIFSDLDNIENNSTINSDDGKGNRQMKGFATVMFKVTEVSGERNEIITYELRELSDTWKKQIHPFAYGSFAQRGSFTNTNRQSLIYEGFYPSAYTRYLYGVNNWEFTRQMIGMQFGDLSNLGNLGLTGLDGKSAYLDNVYFTGIIENMPKLEGYSIHADISIIKKTEQGYSPNSFTVTGYKNTSGEGLREINSDDNADILVVAYDSSGSGTELDIDRLGTVVVPNENFSYIIAFLFINGDEVDSTTIGVVSDGEQGDKGISISAVNEYYLASTESSGITLNSKGWKNHPSYTDWGAKKPYLWNYEEITYSEGEPTKTQPSIISYWSKEVERIDEYYATTRLPNPPNKDAFEEANIVVYPTASHPYLWNYQVTFYTDGSIYETDIALIGVFGEKGDKGDKGDSGLSGCVTRTWEGWDSTKAYRNDTNNYGNLENGGDVRYIDIVLFEDSNAAVGYSGYMCAKVDAETGVNIGHDPREANSQWWTKMSSLEGLNVAVMIARNANIKFGSAFQMAVYDDNNVVVGGLQGVVNDEDVGIWYGDSNPNNAPFKVTKSGRLEATNAKITGEIHAEKGSIGGLSIIDNTITVGTNISGTTIAPQYIRLIYQDTFSGSATKKVEAKLGASAEYLTTAPFYFYKLNTASGSVPTMEVVADNGSNMEIAFKASRGLVISERGFISYCYNVTEAQNSGYLTFKKGNNYLLQNTSSSSKTVYLPRSQEVVEMLGGNTISLNAAIEITITAHYNNANSIVLKNSTGKIYNHNGGEESQYTLQKGDSITFLMVYQGSSSYAQLLNHND